METVNAILSIILGYVHPQYGEVHGLCAWTINVFQWVDGSPG